MVFGICGTVGSSAHTSVGMVHKQGHENVRILTLLIGVMNARIRIGL